MEGSYTNQWVYMLKLILELSSFHKKLSNSGTKPMGKMTKSPSWVNKKGFSRIEIINVMDPFSRQYSIKTIDRYGILNESKIR